MLCKQIFVGKWPCLQNACKDMILFTGLYISEAADNGCCDGQ